ncbi:hypothetical protein K2173_000959 [Erythroxylum novogranatense]|uniref:Uncharacterized protein n=1 Tax=Erythroxylum novogranatense TaxID=1862640 RepID=A0AAV8TTG8_9ROSI|nr:hypothetical protein K2173_000959 [Erythroxylum novogranatense]
MSVKRVGVEFMGIEKEKDASTSFLSFPKLKILSFGGFTEWKEWDDIDEWLTERINNKTITIMSSLQKVARNSAEKDTLYGSVSSYRGSGHNVYVKSSTIWHTNSMACSLKCQDYYGENIKPSYGGDDEAFLRKVVTPIYRVIQKFSPIFRLQKGFSIFLTIS